MGRSMRMNHIIFIRALFLVSYLILFCSCSFTNRIENNKTHDQNAYQGYGFVVDIDTDVKVSVKNPVEDYFIYTFAYNNFDFLYAYVGNFPDYPIFHPIDVTKQSFLINNMAAECMEWQDRKNTFSKECLIDLGGDVYFPRYIHFWYQNLVSQDRQRADKIIASLQRHLEPMGQ